MGFRIFLSILTFVYVQSAYAGFLARYSDAGPGARELIEETRVEAPADEQRYPRYVVEHSDANSEWIVEVWAPTREELRALLKSRGVKAARVEPDPAQEEVVTLISNGPSKNRIDLVFMGDGY